MHPLRRFLAAHDYYDSDRIYPSCVRIIVHRDPKKAAVWEFVEVFGKKVLRIKANLDSSGSGTIGWYLTAPSGSERAGSSTSNFLAVTSDVGFAMPVTTVALPKE